MTIPRHGSEWAVTPIGRIQSTVRGLCVVPKNHRINGQSTSPVTLQTHTLHCLGAHLWRYPDWWENVREHQCFCFERVGSELTQTLSAWNGRGKGGSYLARRLRLKEASRLYVDRHITGCDITGYMSQQLSTFGTTTACTNSGIRCRGWQTLLFS